LPEEYVDGVLVEYNVLSVKQVFDDGRAPVIFTEAPKLYWWDDDFINTAAGLGPGKWFHSKGPYDGERNFECVLFYVDGLYRETVIFEIEYEMFNASLRYADSAELYISLFSGSSVNFLRHFKGQILFPYDIMPRAGNFNAFTYGTNSHTFPFSESTTKNPGYHTFYFELDESQLKFRPYNQYIEFALVSFGDDKHIFTQHASNNRYSINNMLANLRREQAEYEALPETYKAAKVTVLIIFTAGAAITFLIVYLVNMRVRKKHVFYQPSMQIDYFRDIPSQLDPNFAAALVFCKHSKSNYTRDGYAAVMLDLVRKGYIELERVSSANDWNSDNVRIIIKHVPNAPSSFCGSCGSPASARDQFCAKCGSPVNVGVVTPILEPLTPTEEQYFNMIVRHSAGSANSGITVRTFRQRVSSDHQYSNYFLETVKRVITSIGVSGGYFQKADYKKPKTQMSAPFIPLVIIGVVVLVLVNFLSYQTRLHFAYGAFFIFGAAFIASAIYLKLVSRKYILLTQFGEDEYSKWRGLYNFLNSETLMSERTVVELAIWEQYLVYATAFGISEKVIKALQIRCSESYMSSSNILCNPYYRSRVFYHSCRSIRTATRTASHTYRSGSHGGGFGGGGGYGGGGRGGGGGGGGH